MKRKLMRAVALALGLGVAAAPGYAQQGNGGNRPGLAGLLNGGTEVSLVRLPAPLLARLELTEEQKQKLAEIQQRAREELRGLVEVQAGDRQAAFRKLQAVNQKAETDAAALLSPKQKQQLDAMKTEAAKYPGLGPSSIGLLAVTGLTDEQKGQLKDLSFKIHGQRQSLFQTLQGGGDRQAAVQALRAQSEAVQTGIKQILTPEQFKQFQEAVPTGGPFGGRPGSQN